MEDQEQLAHQEKINLREWEFHIVPLAMEIFSKIKIIAVIGGGNSALEEAVALTKYASSVTVVHQFDHFQAFESAIREAKSIPK